MQKFIIVFLTLALGVALGCDEPETTETQEEPVDLEMHDEDHDDEHAHDEDHDHDHDHAAEDEGDADDEVEVTSAEDGKVAITATASAFEPSNIEAPAGEELTLEFTRTAEAGCMTEVVFPDHDIEKELPLDETVAIAITPEEGEVIGFECGMGMGKSTVTGT